MFKHKSLCYIWGRLIGTYGHKTMSWIVVKITIPDHIKFRAHQSHLTRAISILKHQFGSKSTTLYRVSFDVDLNLIDQVVKDIQRTQSSLVATNSDFQMSKAEIISTDLLLLEGVFLPKQIWYRPIWWVFFVLICKINIKKNVYLH